MASIHEMPNGNLRVRWRNAAGTQKSKNFTVKLFPNARERRRAAEDYGRNQERRRDLGIPEIDTTQTLSDVMAAFIPVVIERKAPKTQEGYRSLWNAHIEPEFGKWPLAEIQVGDIEDWLAGWDGKTPTQRKALVLLGQMFRFALKRRWAAANPVELVDKPKLARKEPVDPPTPLEVEQIRKKFLDREMPREAMMVSVWAYAGCRSFSEGLHLSRADIGERTILVRDEKRSKIKTVDILPPLREDLDWWLEQIPPFPGTPLFPNFKGEHWTRTQYDNWRDRDVWQPIIGSPKPKNLRHTFVSLLIRDESISRLEIAAQAGHSLDIQESTYAHIWKNLRGTGTPEDAIREARAQVFGNTGADAREGGNVSSL